MKQSVTNGRLSPRSPNNRYGMRLEQGIQRGYGGNILPIYALILHEYLQWLPVTMRKVYSIISQMSISLTQNDGMCLLHQYWLTMRKLVGGTRFLRGMSRGLF